MLNKFKNILYPAVIIVFCAFTFQSNPPGWYQQSIPVNDQINDIYFMDSLKGWIVTNGHPTSNDTAYILKTSNGGDNWFIQFKVVDNISVVQFLDSNFGYASGGFGRLRFFKTTNGGATWDTTLPFGSSVGNTTDLSFINRDTGWIASNDNIGGGVFKTINGGQNWIRQSNPSTLPTKLQFIDADTGWAVFNGNQLHKTTNGGTNWFLQIISLTDIRSIFFLNGLKGWAKGRVSSPNNVDIMYTTDGGSNWQNSSGISVVGGFDIKFVNDSVGWAGTFTYPYIMKSTDGGRTWGVQIVPYLSRD